MTRPLKKELPKGSRIGDYVRRLIAEARDAMPFWQWDNKDVRALGVWAELRGERRIWVLPRELVRDELVLPAIASIEGRQAADAMKRQVPNVLDHYVDLICEDAKRQASARERLAPTTDISWAVVMVVLAALYDRYDGTITANANYERAARRLGVNRAAVRRTDQDFRRRAGMLPELDRAALFAAVRVAIERLAEYDRQIGKRAA
ncbi:hypothetical protein SAMN05216228_100849 [Rhizobium tibeticum]|uniref:Uncharacterized protein n=1 Tax=Rhizobium tibeticum TaxID=501024 RepID=A0A1H8JT04_9HYPH|nr:hypothetical protein [Rhizobium tibeticum]SEH79526.1 hypothetical protein RTCCBAU85039_2409 [Rhizobium tibeticum]SEN83873.1 hypothetical protein SAMN05216228_100849 [Rhizobium tibeticum]